MTKSNQRDPLPEEFSSYEEAGRFWDAHDTTTYPEAFQTIEPGRPRDSLSKYWKTPSALKLAGRRDPIEVITEKAQDVVFKALEEGWSGPPFDPIALAEILKIKVLPRSDVGDAIDDARIISDPGGKLVIEYNPNKPPARVRFSICHEIAHSFFPDCADHVRHRVAHSQVHGADRQLEMLCNLAAAELLMPIGSFPEITDDDLTIDRVLELRRKFEASTEAVLIRTVNLSKVPVAAFSAVANETGGALRYAIEYCISSKKWEAGVKSGFVLPEGTALKNCIAIGYTTKESEIWNAEMGKVVVQAVGVPPYPGPAQAKPSDYYHLPGRVATQSVPRVVGFIRPKSSHVSLYPSIVYVKRDATEPVDSNSTIIAHIVNDKTPNWGAGFGRFIAKKWPVVQEKFRDLWTRQQGLPLGTTSFTDVAPGIAAFHMVAQHGYGRSNKPLLRYEKLRECLQQLAHHAVSRQARVQMPRIGAGEAGGSWPVIEEMIEETLCRHGVRVTVCDLPGVQPKDAAQLELVEQIKRTA
ncbi:MAG TPA: ImmA/IrrE family metallo-endopeptidase [Candidatus Sulfotelmatobacter sp.]|jgi:Zn-dependent peptidase ImmA (M78 family)|nr:ImmA/IrrE family metallo-endopeptidase [Candidatus Sulfotelmatobacter sp.]